jgi:hypothetical protein
MAYLEIKENCKVIFRSAKEEPANINTLSKEKIFDIVNLIEMYTGDIYFGSTMNSKDMLQFVCSKAPIKININGEFKITNQADECEIVEKEIVQLKEHINECIHNVNTTTKCILNQRHTLRTLQGTLVTCNLSETVHLQNTFDNALEHYKTKTVELNNCQGELCRSLQERDNAYQTLTLAQTKKYNNKK